jgi:hypothetical protein
MANTILFSISVNVTSLGILCTEILVLCDPGLRRFEFQVSNDGRCISRWGLSVSKGDMSRIQEVHMG